MERKNAHDALVEGFFEIGIAGVDFVEIQILLALFVDGLGDEAFKLSSPAWAVKNRNSAVLLRICFSRRP